MGRALRRHFVVGLGLVLALASCAKRRADPEVPAAKPNSPSAAETQPAAAAGDACRLHEPVDPVGMLAPTALILSPAFMKAKGVGSGTTIPLLGLEPGSFGEKCGFRNGDALIDVNDFPASEYPKVGGLVADSVGRQGEARVRVLRDGRIITIRIALVR